MGQAELRSPFNKERNIVPDGTFIERTVFFDHDVLNCGALFLREALSQTVNDRHEGPGFKFFGHCRSFDPTSSRVNGLLSPARTIFCKTIPIRTGCGFEPMIRP